MKKYRYKNYFATALMWCGITFPTMAQEAPRFTVAEAPEWSALFKRKDGWFGADGIFVLPLNGVDNDKNKAKTMMLVFSDTMIGKIKGTSLQPGFKMIHNSVAILKGEAAQDKNISFYWKSDRKGSPQPLFKPETKNSEPGEYFWLGDGFVNNDMDKATYIFAYRIKDTGGAVFGFAEKGNVLIKIPAGSKPPFLDQKQMDTPFYIAGKTDSETGSFGGGIFVNTANAGAQSPDGFVYVYGVKGSEKNVIVARVEPGKFEQFKEWKFWDGSTWNSDISKVAGIADHASNELSVSQLSDGRYVMVFQAGGWGNNVGMRIGSSPVGPFGPVIKIWDCKDAIEAKNFFAYNAKAHPALSKPGELIISYNVNSFDFWNDVKKFPQLYRPRFIRLKFTD